MDTQPTHFESTLTTFFKVKISPEWLGFTFETRLAHARDTFQPILDEFRGRVRLKWYDVEFYRRKLAISG
jgi:hypothetical protein